MLLGLWEWAKENATSLLSEVVAGIWALYRYFDQRKPSEPKADQSHSGNGDIVAGDKHIA